MALMKVIGSPAKLELEKRGAARCSQRTGLDMPDLAFRKSQCEGV